MNYNYILAKQNKSVMQLTYELIKIAISHDWNDSIPIQQWTGFKPEIHDYTNVYEFNDNVLLFHNNGSGNDGYGKCVDVYCKVSPNEYELVTFADKLSGTRKEKHEIIFDDFYICFVTNDYIYVRYNGGKLINLEYPFTKDQYFNMLLQFDIGVEFEVLEEIINYDYNTDYKVRIYNY